MNILCLASYEKGHEFLRQAKRQGCGVLLVTSLSLQGNAEWPAEAIDEIFYMPDQDHAWNRADTIKAVSYLARTRPIDRVVALDDFDVDMAASLRPHRRQQGGELPVPPPPHRPRRGARRFRRRYGRLPARAPAPAGYGRD